MRAPLLLAVLLAGCGSMRGLRPGGTEQGLAVGVSSADPVLARRAAVESVLGLYLSPQRRAASAEAIEDLLSRPARFTGKEKLKPGAGVVEVKLAPLASALEEAGLVRPAGFPKGPGRVLLVLSEPAGGLNVGYASDALRRALSARGVSAADASDTLLQRPGFSPPPPEQLVRDAFAKGVDFVLLGNAAAEPTADPGSGVFRAEALLDAHLMSAPGDAGQPVDADGSAVDVSSAAALSKALEAAGDAAAAPVSAAIAASRQGRSEVVVEARGAGGPNRMGGLIATLRGLKGVKGAALLTHRTDEGSALVTAYCEGIKADELAARLLRADSTLVVLGVEPENQRLIVELGSPEAY